MADWPRRAPAARPRGAPVPRLRGKGPADADPDGPPRPGLVPRSVREAWLANFVILGVMATLVGLLAYVATKIVHASLPAQVGMAAIGVGSVLTLIVFTIELVVYTLPTSLGLRRPRGPANTRTPGA